MKMNPSRSLTRTCLIAALLFSSLPARADGAQATASNPPPATTSTTKFTGLPVTGQLDPALVVAARSGQSAAQAPAAVAIPAGGITNITLDTTGVAQAQAMIPVTFGQVFAASHLSPSESLMGKFADGTSIPLQVDVKATHPDGSVRHAVISGVVPQLAAGQRQGLAIVKAGPVTELTAKIGALLGGGDTATPAALAGAGFAASVSATIDGQQYTASADNLLKQQKPTTWLSGSTVTEWLVSAPLKTAQGVEHPQLSARFAIRWYSGIKKARVDVTMENAWAYQPGPRNITYDAQVSVGGKQVYARPGLTHLHHARWRKVFWWGEAPSLHVRHNTRYLIASLALPSYDQSLAIPEASLAALKAGWTGAKTEPMGVGQANPGMPTTGGREDIGLLPGWAALYLLSMDARAKEVTLGTADLAGSWSAHYRDQRTGKPISLLDYPYMTISGRSTDTVNPATGKQEAFPVCPPADCTTPNTHDIPHQPAFAYLPYMVTGDHYYLEELQFWAMYDVFSANPGYRQNAKGLLSPEQVRGQAWGLRTLVEAAYITPDADRLKAHFNKIVDSNLDWYNSTYTNNAAANRLGAIINGYALGYTNGTGLAPWQDDFFTSAVGHAVDLGFTKAAPLLAWKAKFPVARMTGQGACWIDGAIYSMIVRDSATSPIYNTIAQAYAASHTPEFAALPCAGADMAAALKLQQGEMTGFSSAAMGYPSNMQPALAYAAGVSGQAGINAWTQFMARTVKPDYGPIPQFAIVPR